MNKRYARVEALREVSFTVEEGITGLIGPNGAGKSTFIKALLGLIKATTGKAEVFGLDSRKEKSKIMERVGVLHEKPGLPSWVTARQYLEYVAQLKKLSKVPEEVEKAATICNLEGYMDRKIGTFSAGMVQRLGLADALIGKPELVILDEPTANLDPLGRHEVLSKIRALREEEGMNFLISTHILPELERVCDNVVILNGGRVVTYGPFKELLAKYSTRKYIVKVNDPKRFLESLSKKAVANAEMKNDLVILEFVDEARLVEEVNGLVRAGGFTLKEFRPSSATLEDIFIEELRRKQG